MRRMFAGNRHRRRGRQLHDGRSRARSLVPVALLAVCMFAVLYGNVSLYTDRISSKYQKKVPILMEDDGPQMNAPPRSPGSEATPGLELSSGVSPKGGNLSFPEGENSLVQRGVENHSDYDGNAAQQTETFEQENGTEKSANAIDEQASGGGEGEDEVDGADSADRADGALLEGIEVKNSAEVKDFSEEKAVEEIKSPDAMEIEFPDGEKAEHEVKNSSEVEGISEEEWVGEDEGAPEEAKEEAEKNAEEELEEKAAEVAEHEVKDSSEVAGISEEEWIGEDEGAPEGSKEEAEEDAAEVMEHAVKESSEVTGISEEEWIEPQGHTGDADEQAQDAGGEETNEDSKDGTGKGLSEGVKGLSASLSDPEDSETQGDGDGVKKENGEAGGEREDEKFEDEPGGDGEVVTNAEGDEKENAGAARTATKNSTGKSTSSVAAEVPTDQGGEHATQEDEQADGEVARDFEPGDEEGSKDETKDSKESPKIDIEIVNDIQVKVEKKEGKGDEPDGDGAEEQSVDEGNDGDSKSEKQVSKSRVRRGVDGNRVYGASNLQDKDLNDPSRGEPVVEVEGTRYQQHGGNMEQMGAKAGVPADHELPMNGAVRGSMKCEMTKQGHGAENIMNIATWKDVPGDADYRGPLFQAQESANETLYVTLDKDLGGFNNIRMSLECGVAFAAATGRTFVIPPPFPIWNMNVKGSRKDVDLRRLFSFDKLRDSGRVKVITTQEFLEREAITGNLSVRPSEDVLRLKVKVDTGYMMHDLFVGRVEVDDLRTLPCHHSVPLGFRLNQLHHGTDDTAVAEYMRVVASQFGNGLPSLAPDKAGMIMPRTLGDQIDLTVPEYRLAKQWLYRRELTEYVGDWQTAKVIHWRADKARLLAPFYAFVLHTDSMAERYYKRLMRDLVHYPEEVYCKASQVITLLKAEDPSGSFSSFHIRRNDFLPYYKPSDLTASDIVANSKEHLVDGEVVYIATDEKNHSMFKPFEEGYRVRFLSDYYEEAGVAELSPNTIGMLEQIIASHGRTFTGCWFSTFSAYILRLRGHLGQPRDSSFYYQAQKATAAHTYRLPSNPLWATEWPFGWEGIDNTGVPDPMAP